MKNIRIYLFLNILIVVLTLTTSIIIITGFKFMNGNEIVLETTKLGLFKYFTIQSNTFMGLISLIFFS